MKNAIKEQSNIVSISTVQMCLTENMQDYGMPNITLKKYVARASPDGQIETMKDERIQKIKSLEAYKALGYRVCFIEETHWRMGLVSKEARYICI